MNAPIICREVRLVNGALHWTLVVPTRGGTSVVFAATLPGGQLLDLQTGDLCGTTGDRALDERIAHWLAARTSWHRTQRQLGDPR